MTFDDWFEEFEGFSTRGERIMEMECVDALRATWEAATAEERKRVALIGLPVIDQSMLEVGKKC